MPSSSVPVEVFGLSGGVQAITAGDFHSCALVGGVVVCWGLGSSGQLGNGSTSPINSAPVPVAPWAP
jgi:hypothetical protein